MFFEVIWSDFAEKQLDAIFDYYLESANEKIALKMVQGLLNEPGRLQKDPFIGQVEELT